MFLDNNFKKSYFRNRKHLWMFHDDTQVMEQVMTMTLGVLHNKVIRKTAEKCCSLLSYVFTNGNVENRVPG